jgi:hypothetical protein
MAELDPVEQLLAIEEIRRLKARYFRYIDLQDWESFAKLFTPDAVMDMREGMPERAASDSLVQGPENITAFARETVTKVRHTVHHGFMPEIELLSATTARAIWAMSDRLRRVPGMGDLVVFTGFGHYHDTYERIEGVWLIKRIHLSRLPTDGLPLAQL